MGGGIIEMYNIYPWDIIDFRFFPIKGSIGYPHPAKILWKNHGTYIRPILPYMCATCSKLPCYISTLGKLWFLYQ